MTTERSFIPRNKPKSWVVSVIACLSCLLVGAPLIFLGSAIGWDWMVRVGFIIVVLSVVTTFGTTTVFLGGMATGKYKALEPRKWREQLW
jgi:hypothetical protein